jgi:hypothetical protein
MGRPAMIPEEAVDVGMPIDYASRFLDFMIFISDFSAWLESATCSWTSSPHRTLQDYGRNRK